MLARGFRLSGLGVGGATGIDAAEKRKNEALSETTMSCHQMGVDHRILETLFFREKLKRYQCWEASAPTTSLDIVITEAQ